VGIDPNCPKRASVVACPAHGLVLGGPGSGKTTVALHKAVALIQKGLRAGQSVLFLSFSRAAVTRVLDAARLEVPKKDLSLLSVQTFHAFFWRVLKTHGYLLGAPKRLEILLPQDEKAICGGISPDNEGWAEWLVERERMFREDGRVAFDLFAPKTAALLARCQHLSGLIGAAHPLIIVDEAQDTGSQAWSCVELLAPGAQILCLADLEQQIYDFLPGVGPERVAEIRAALDPFEVDLGGENGRSPDTEILAFANDILTARPRGAPYKGVQQIGYEPKTVKWNWLLRRAIGAAIKAAEASGGARPTTIAVLTDTTRNALKASNALNAVDIPDGKPVAHKLHFDEAEALLTARLAAFLLEPKDPAREDDDVATCIELLASARRATGTAKAEVATLQQRAQQIRAGKPPKVKIVKALRGVLATLRVSPFAGDPPADWLLAKRALRESGEAALVRAAQQLDFMVAFQRGHRISAALSAEWVREGTYTRARAALDAALAQEQILDGAEMVRGIQVMNWHKAKGKQFDAVILLREPRFGADGKRESSFVWRGDEPPYSKSRRLVRVAATRARDCLIILSPNWPACPLLEGHILGKG
jgi:DNA helicase II / ATP-dependent DNA helicase PcrA